MRWQMKLNVDKCKLMCIGRQNPTSSSTLLHFKLTGTTQGKGPGVIVSSSMKTSVTSAAAGSKANTALPEQGTLQIVIGVTVMWQGTGTASFHGSREGTGIQEPLIPSRIEDIAPSGSLEHQRRGAQSSSGGCGFPGQSDGQISPALHAEPQIVHMGQKLLGFVGGSLSVGSKSQKNPGVALQLMCSWLGLPAVVG